LTSLASLNEIPDMPIFVVIATKNASDVEARIDALASEPGRAIDRFYPLRGDTWFVSYRGTTKELAEMLGIRQGETGSGVVVSIENYSGRASNDLWEWLKLNMSGD
jgi:hypothetical protein